MEFFTLDLLKKINSAESQNERCQILDVWNDKSNQYWNEFSHIKRKLPTEFAQLFESGCFHDSRIKSLCFDIAMLKKKNRADIKLKISDDKIKGELLHCDVKSFNCSLVDVNQCVKCFEYLYGEILMDKDNYVTHNFLVSSGDEIVIKCKGLKWIPND